MSEAQRMGHAQTSGSDDGVYSFPPKSDGNHAPAVGPQAGTYSPPVPTCACPPDGQSRHLLDCPAIIRLDPRQRERLGIICRRHGYTSTTACVGWLIDAHLDRLARLDQANEDDAKAVKAKAKKRRGSAPLCSTEPKEKHGT